MAVLRKKTTGKKERLLRKKRPKQPVLSERPAGYDDYMKRRMQAMFNDPNWHAHVAHRVSKEGDDGRFKIEVSLNPPFATSLVIYEKMGSAWVNCGEIRFNGFQDYTIEKMEALSEQLPEMLDYAVRSLTEFNDNHPYVNEYSDVEEYLWKKRAHPRRK